ncbi:MAG: Maf family protein [Sulfitobacter sp.]
MSIILASGSAIRHQLLTQAAVAHEVILPRIDEESVKQALQAENAAPRDIADTLAEMKARKISEKHPEALVIGCDQVLDLNGQMLNKPETPQEARDQLIQMSGNRHILLSAAVICQAGKPLWRHIGQVRMLMRQSSDTYIDSYIEKNWDQIRHCVGAYQLEGEGVRLFTKVEGDYFHVLGLPLLELLAYLTLRGELET